MDFLDADAASMGASHQEEGGYVSSSIFGVWADEHLWANNFESISNHSRPLPRQIHSALQNEAVYVVSSLGRMLLEQSRRRAMA